MREQDAGSERDLGQRIRDLRKQNKVTLLELSQAVGVTESFVSQVERGVANPSVATLRRIARALNADMASLFVGSDVPGMVVRASERKRMAHPAGSLEDQILTPPTAKTLQIHHSTIAAGHGSEEQYSHAADEECVIVLSGQLDIEVEEETHRLLSGDALLLHPYRPHGYRNPGPGPTTALWVMSPPVY